MSLSTTVERSTTGAAPATLRARLAAAGPRPGATLLASDGETLCAALVEGSVLGANRASLGGRSVLLITGGQHAAARAMVDLDGLVARMVVCPPDLRPEHRPSIIADAEVDTIVTDLDPPKFDGLSARVVRCDWPLTPLARGAAPPASTEWVLATSGTSGAPKLVVHSLAALTAAIGPVPADRRMVWGTFYDIRRYGGLQIFLRAILAGCSLVLSSAQEPLGNHLGRLAGADVTHLSGTPSHWRRLLMSSEASLLRPGTVRLSGEIADQAVLDALAESYPTAAIGHAYASTEAGVGFEVTDGLEGFPVAYLDRPACTMRVVDGSLRIRSSRMASRYLGHDAAALADADGFIDTGDMVEQRGDRMYFVGRRGGIINVGGLKVHPEEIETVINRHEDVLMSLVRSRRSPIMGSIVIADVVLREGATPDAVRGAIMQACRDSLPTHKIPATLRFVDAVEVTAAGKLARSPT